MNLSNLPTGSRIALYVLGILFVAVIIATAWLIYALINYFKKNTDVESDSLLYADVAYFYEKGKRQRQEDSLFISPLDRYREDGIVACVADGMGGLMYGRDISKYIVDEIGKMLPFDFNNVYKNLSKLTKLSNTIYYKYDRKGGATLALVQIFKNKLHLYSIGDSNIILIRNNNATILNQKHNYYNVLVKSLSFANKTTEEAYLNKKSRALTDFMGNTNARIMSTNNPITLLDGDTIVICSDGVTDALPYNKLPYYLGNSARKSADEIKLNIRHKNLSKQDNYSCIVISLKKYSF